MLSPNLFPASLVPKSLAIVKQRLRAFSVALIVCVAFPWAAHAQSTAVPVPSWRYDLTEAGQNTHETVLTPGNVNASTFGKLFSVNVDSTVYAQPLYIPGLTMNDGRVHNVLFVATENDSIYAFDADSNTGSNATPLWKATLLDAAHGAGPGAEAIRSAGTAIAIQGDIGPTIGITGTAVINPATNTMYVVGNTEESGVFYSRLHAINIITGAEQTAPAVLQSPVEISATVPGTGQGSSGGNVSFDPLMNNQRPALVYYNGYVYIGYSSHGDIGPWHGWLFAYDATAMQQTDVLCLSPNGYGASLWSSGAGFPVDTDGAGGRMFMVTGNGTFSTNDPPFTPNSELSESILRLNLSGGKLTLEDGFTSFNAQYLNNGDYDQGSGGILMFPDQEGTNPHILLQEGKEGRVLVLNRDDLGGFASGASSNTNILQDLPGETKGTWSTPAYWNGRVYIWGSGDNGGSSDTPKMFSVTNGVLSSEPISVGTISSGFPGASFTISSNGAEQGIAWAVRTDQYSTGGPSILYAWDATDLTNILYESDTNAARDSAGSPDRFALATVTNGKVYVAGKYHVTVYGLLNGKPTAAAPKISPNGGTVPVNQTVTLTTTTSSAQIFYTLDGSAPTTASTLYSGPFQLSASATLHAIAVAAGFTQSPEASAQFNVETQTPAAGFSPPAGTFTSNQQVTITDSDAAAKIYYTTDGSTPTASSALYAGPITVSASETISAIAIDPAMFASPVTTAAYVITAPPPPPPTPTLTLTATTPAAVAPGNSTTSTITLTPGGGLTGTVSITCSITSSPVGAVHPPACSATQPTAITGSAAVTSTLTVSTTGPSTSDLHPLRIFEIGSGTALAVLGFFAVPLRWRRATALLGLLVFVALAGAIGCGGSTKTVIQNPGTTAGNYTVTVTAISGSVKSTTSVSVTVQ